MLIRLTLPTKNELFLHSDLIKIVERNLSNILETAITTSFITQRGPLIYSVLETPEQVAELVNLALRGELSPAGTKGIIH